MQTFVDEAACAIIVPALGVAGMAGGALVGLSSDVYDFSQTWLSIGGAVWLFALLFAAIAYPPTWLRVINPTEQRRAQVGGLLHLSLAVMLILMTWKFGV